MLAKMIDKIVSLKETKIFEIDGQTYGQPSYIMELTPAFTDVIVKRYIRITGKTTVRCVRQGRELPREEIAAIFEPDEEGGEQE